MSNFFLHIIRVLFSPVMVMLFVLLGMIACREIDETPPTITLNGSDSVSMVLNGEYNEQGAEAVDDTEGNITSKLYIENNVDVNKVGYYNVIYKAVDESGNEAQSVTRSVEVYNEAEIYTDDYLASDWQENTTTDTCHFFTTILIDSSLNNRILFTNFACDSGYSAFADISNNLLLIPYQKYDDTASYTVFLGSGTINDSLLIFKYNKEVDSVTTYWNSSYERMK